MQYIYIYTSYIVLPSVFVYHVLNSKFPDFPEILRSQPTHPRFLEQDRGPRPGHWEPLLFPQAQSDRVVAVREHAMRAANIAVARCREPWVVLSCAGN